MSVLDQMKTKMTAAIEHLQNGLKNIRTGRANPGMVEHLLIEVYGSSMKLKEVASISTPEARQLLITPFDPQNTSAIGKSIEKSNLGFMPIVDGNAVRIKIPPMTEELRKKMAKICDEECEATKVSIRNIRREGNELLKKQKGELSEDLIKKWENEILDLTKKFCDQADELSEKKKKEISTL